MVSKSARENSDIRALISMKGSRELEIFCIFEMGMTPLCFACIIIIGDISSVDSEYLLTRVLTREYLFFATFCHSSLLEFDLSLLRILERVEY